MTLATLPLYVHHTYSHSSGSSGPTHWYDFLFVGVVLVVSIALRLVRWVTGRGVGPRIGARLGSRLAGRRSGVVQYGSQPTTYGQSGYPTYGQQNGYGQQSSYGAPQPPSSPYAQGGNPSSQP